MFAASNYSVMERFLKTRTETANGVGYRALKAGFWAYMGFS